MPNRREFLQSSAALSAVAMNGLLVREAAAMSAVRNYAGLHTIIYDDRYPEACEFAAAAAEQSVAIRALDAGDVTRLYEELDLLWRSRPFAIGGTTQFGPMFVLEQLGIERGLRTALRVEHRPHIVMAAESTREPFIHYYTPRDVQQGYGPAVDGPLYSWVIAPAMRG
jgi:hypothetical protein